LDENGCFVIFEFVNGRLLGGVSLVLGATLIDAFFFIMKIERFVGKIVCA